MTWPSISASAHLSILLYQSVGVGVLYIPVEGFHGTFVGTKRGGEEVVWKEVQTD